MVALSLVARTVCDLWMIQNGTAVESSIIRRNFNAFVQNLMKFMYAMPLIAVCNNLLKFGLDKLKLSFRSRLSTYLFKMYLSGFTYYKMVNLDNRIANADQLLTQDVEKFCNSLADLYSNISKPLLDICIYVKELTGAIGAQGPAFMLAYLAVSGLVLTRLRGPVGGLTVTEQRLEGELRFVNSRLITNCEEIAFYQGNEREKTTVMSALQRLVKHLNKFIWFRFLIGIVDTVTAKYLATCVGYCVVSRPFLDLSHPRHLHSTHTQLMEDYYRSGRMLVRLAQAIGRLVLAGREMTRLAGYTARVTELITVLKDLNQGTYKRTMVTNSQSQQKSASREPSQPFVPGTGELIEMDNIISFDHVPLVTPNGDILIPDLTFEVRSGMNCLVCGPNGCGKSSLFRVLGELWPLFGGRLVKPHREKLFYIPQRPYMTLGTLRDQITYPDTVEQMHAKGFTDEGLAEYMKQVQLNYILERDEGWDTVQDWMDVLSGGEKQRVAMARLLYHKPQFAILDECTSAVSVDVEGMIYRRCREMDITLFTVSHRKSLWQHHEFVLQFDGHGAYEFKRIEPGMDEFGS
ncbi:ATP-binding cassette sub-family D member 3-like isoform X2 [Corticium candelabrum]|nr:ATP-binding cassette sub-family D member 3-like isoform X2 [Corticium candelabrum]